MTDEWGPWIEHDGKGCPCVGQYVAAVFECNPGQVDQFTTFMIARGGESWFWEKWCTLLPDGRLCARIIRYRIRKPRALLDLIERARELDDAPQGPVRTSPKVPA